MTVSSEKIAGGFSPQPTGPVVPRLDDDERCISGKASSKGEQLR